MIVSQLVWEDRAAEGWPFGQLWLLSFYLDIGCAYGAYPRVDVTMYAFCKWCSLGFSVDRGNKCEVRALETNIRSTRL